MFKTQNEARSPWLSVALRGKLFAVAALLSAPLLMACGPNFPNNVLNNPTVGEMPSQPYAALWERIEWPKPPKEFTGGEMLKGEGARATAEVDAAELDAALERQGVPAKRRAPIVQQYDVVRQTLAKHSEESARWHENNWWMEADKRSPRPVPPPLALPAGLPEEFALYMKGAQAWRSGDDNAARKAWQDLLKLPAKERHYRSTWAAFMLARSWVDSSPADAIPWLEALRKLNEDGFADSLGLARDSYGWEARAELKRKNCERAIELYMYRPGGDDVSLRWACDALFRAGPDTLGHAARNPKLHLVVSLQALDRDSWLGWRSAWLKAVETADVRDMAAADVLAAVAYNAGDMDAARRWLARAPADSLTARWLRARLLLRDGKLDEAAKLLAEIAPRLPQWADVDGYGRAVNHPLGDLGALRLSRRQYVESLNALLRGRYWQDAAYVAERVLTPDELKRYVDRNWPPPADMPETKWRLFGPDSAEATPSMICHLLARRLTRLGRWKDARPYFPQNLRPRLDAYIAAIRAGNDAARPASERAASLWGAAKLARREGMELLGTELEPDWAIYGGSYEGSPLAQWRVGQEFAGPFAPSDDERRRTALPPAAPQKRFHYRYTAADHAWAAAELMPDQDDATAEVLCEAGGWLKDRDPMAADRFYKALVRRCGRTDLGREADRRRWFPK